MPGVSGNVAPVFLNDPPTESRASSPAHGWGAIVDIVCGAGQGDLGKSSDKCDMTVNGKPAQELFF
jgi:hypothetical protein